MLLSLLVVVATLTSNACGVTVAPEIAINNGPKSG